LENQRTAQQWWKPRKISKKGCLLYGNNFSKFRKLTKVEGPLVIKLGSPKNGKVNFCFERTFCQGRWLKIGLIFFLKSYFWVCPENWNLFTA
jgi:hypothetical protein